MDALSLHRKIVSSYQDYIRSFIDIHDDDIRDRVEEESANGNSGRNHSSSSIHRSRRTSPLRSWLRKASSTTKCATCFMGIRFTPTKSGQSRSGRTARASSSPPARAQVRPSPTSEPSSTHLFATGSGQGIQGILVYPMNALINSQERNSRNSRKTTSRSQEKPSQFGSPPTPGKRARGAG